MSTHPIPFETRNTRAALEAEQQANAQAEQAGHWLTELTAQKAETATREAACVASDFAADDVAEFLTVKSQLRDVETVANCVLAHGGPDGGKLRFLTSENIFERLGRGYGEPAGYGLEAERTIEIIPRLSIGRFRRTCRFLVKTA